MVSVIKTAILLEEYTTEKQRSVVSLIWAKELNAKDIHKEIFLFMLGSDCRVKQFHSGGK
jgi:hypothetical protein